MISPILKFKIWSYKEKTEHISLLNNWSIIGCWWNPTSLLTNDLTEADIEIKFNFAWSFKSIKEIITTRTSYSGTKNTYFGNFLFLLNKYKKISMKSRNITINNQDISWSSLRINTRNLIFITNKIIFPWKFENTTEIELIGKMIGIVYENKEELISFDIYYLFCTKR